MKKRFIKALAIPVVFAAGLAAASCTGNTPTPADTTTTEKAPEPTTTVETTTVETTTETTTSETPIVKKDVYDDITKTLKLTKNYEGKVFETDGIEEVTLVHNTDGDTARFQTKSNKLGVTVRFYGVNTPESTAGVEKWGKSASKFTANILSNAYALLLESSVLLEDYDGAEDYTPPVDGVGGRALCYVWYKATEDSEWMNLNLQLVENGYSDNKILPPNPYLSAFTEAEKFAKKVPLHIWSDEEDPNYSDSAEEVTLKELSADPEKYGSYEGSTFTGVKVRFTAYAKSVNISQTGTYTWVFAEEVDGVEYTFNVYTGYSNQGASGVIRLGNLYSVCGTVQKYSGKFQVSGIQYVAGEKSLDYLQTLQKAYVVTFKTKVDTPDRYYRTALYSDAKVTEASVEGSILTMKIKAVNQYYAEDDPNYPSDEFTCKVEVAAGFNASSLVGKTISTSGIQTEDGVIKIIKYSDIIIK